MYSLDVEKQEFGNLKGVEQPKGRYHLAVERFSAGLQIQPP